MQDFSDLEQDLEETTAEDSRQGKDMQVCPIPCESFCKQILVHRNTRVLLLQGIPWDRMQFSREHYRVSLEATLQHKGRYMLVFTHELMGYVIC